MLAVCERRSRNVLFFLARYLLISKPPEWSSALRFKFLEGFYAFLELLKCMQVCALSFCLSLYANSLLEISPVLLLHLSVSVCVQGMDPITRQVGQHIEMEPEWEAAFTLQMKLTHIISMMQDWCSIDVSIAFYFFSSMH